jgi:hypothetical protein
MLSEKDDRKVGRARGQAIRKLRSKSVGYGPWAMGYGLWGLIDQTGAAFNSATTAWMLAFASPNNMRTLSR